MDDKFTLVPKTDTPYDEVDGNSADASLGEGHDGSHPNKQMDDADVSQDDKASANLVDPNNAGFLTDVHQIGARQHHMSKPIQSEKEMSKTMISSTDEHVLAAVARLQQGQQMRQHQNPDDNVMQMLVRESGTQRFVLTPSSDKHEDNYRLITDVATTASLMEQAKTEIKQLKNDLKEMKDQLQAANERNDALEKGSQELECKYKKLKARYDDLKSEHEELKLEFKKQSEQLQQQSELLEQQSLDLEYLKKMQAQTDEKMAFVFAKFKKSDKEAEIKHAAFVNVQMYSKLIQNMRKTFKKN
eukprot:m.164468 g.164468  ORF g.164468 m.164468 type:complete len:301 (+) comp31340_c2_seq6:579-1481(+)